MVISWYGQACFRFESKDVRILIDPFSKDIGLRPPRLNDNIYLVTHDHYDHNSVEGVSPESFVIRGPGEYERDGAQIVGVNSFHDNEKGAKRGLNTIYVIKFEQITICHMGDFGQYELDDEQLDKIGNIDILMIPVGGTYTIDGKEAVSIVKQIEPKIIVPMHYSVKDLNIKLDNEKTFIKELGIKPESVDQLRISKKALPQDETLAYVFNRG
ncbi:MAG: MBL fold metallo-hydrolase [Parcubacteria group bacterium]